MTLLAKKLVAVAIAAIAAAVAVAVIAPAGVWHYVAAIAVVALVVALVIAAKSAANATEKVLTMREALRNNDFTMRFHDRQNPEINKAFQEISEIIKEEKLKAKQRESYFELIVDSVDSGIIAVDAADNVELCNDSALRLLGLNLLTHLSQLDRVEPGLGNAFRTMTVGESRLLSLPVGGGNAELSAVMSQIDFGETSMRIYIVNNVHSLVERSEVEAWVKLTRVLTHEIMNGIAPIHSISDTLLNGGNIDSPTADSLAVIRSTSEGLMKFTESFRKFAAIPSPVLKLNYVATLMEQSKSLLADMLSGVEVEISVVPDDLILQSDGCLLERVFVNMLKNAVDSGADRIRMEASCAKGEAITIGISDNGAAIPADCIGRIFVPFFTTKSGGSGIGLSVCRRIMSLHCGSIQLQQPSPLPTYTKTFHLQFP